MMCARMVSSTVVDDCSIEDDNVAVLHLMDVDGWKMIPLMVIEV